MASSSASTPAQERDTHILSVGKQCSDPTCLLFDFLPFKCQHCELSFCQEHFKVDAHKCSQYDESRHNRIAPNCPLCDTPVAVRQGQDPNVRMDIHLEKECSVVTGKVKSKSMPVCARGNCKKVLFSPIRCDKCRDQFCPAHRFPADHTCSSLSAPAQRSAKPTTTTTTHLATLGSGAKNLNSKASAVGAAAMGAVKKSMATTTPTATTSASNPRPAGAAPTKSAPNKTSLPFNKTDRRAKAERESKRKAMKAREAKGLLSEEEKATLAAEEAALAQEKKDCVIM
ncbi:hypothetical protein B0H34DRAFT_707581 [Crassisporium funariophilum]|nr:hypothetical protein B0H34DRAFT_707581 [Crassisporium funariophilum]